MQNMVLIAILTDLLIKRKTTRDALAKKYELSPRTITRYVDVLSSAGVPIESHMGIGGGYLLPADYKLDRLLFSQAEYARIREALEQTKAAYDDGLNEKILERIP